MSARNIYMYLAAMLLAGSSRAGEPVTVGQKGLRFSSAELSVAADQAIIFLNNDTTTHNITVVGEGLALNSGLQAPGVEFRVPALKPGTYLVSCGIHPKMKLTLTVK